VGLKNESDVSVVKKGISTSYVKKTLFSHIIISDGSLEKNDI
jgi:hypothetical protein